MKTSRFLFAVFVLVSSIFADTIYLRNGQEVKDASVTEIGVSDVKYKVGKKVVIYTVKKSDIAIIFYTDGTKEVFEAESKNDNATTGQGVQIVQNVQNSVTPTNNINNATASTSNAESRDGYENFTTGQRWGTWGLNLILPGVGSLLIMNDFKGAVTQWILLGGGYALMLTGMETVEDCYGSYYSYCDERDELTTLGYFGAIMVISDFVYNIYRSASYDKPYPKTAYGKYEGFNLAVMPNRRGNLMPAVTYNKMF
jgi:hypothetical protein